MTPPVAVSDDGFGAVTAAIAGVDGWMTEAQAQRLWERAAEVPPGGTIVEIGSFRGRSTIALAMAAARGVAIIAVDPHAGTDRGPAEIRGFEELAEVDHDVFHANLHRAGVGDRVRHVRAFSDRALAAVNGEVDLLFVDGAHRYGPALSDIRVWGGRVRSGGTMLIHDSFSSVGVTLALVRELAFGGRFHYMARTGSLAEYRREPVAGHRRVGNALRQLAQLPWFARNMAIKLLFVARLRPLARVLGHRSDTAPY